MLTNYFYVYNELEESCMAFNRYLQRREHEDDYLELSEVEAKDKIDRIIENAAEELKAGRAKIKEQTKKNIMNAFKISLPVLFISSTILAIVIHLTVFAVAVPLILILAFLIDFIFLDKGVSIYE